MLFKWRAGGRGFVDDKAASPPGIVLGASHESALGDGLKPLHLALLQKDVVTDASRRYLAANAVNAFAAAPDASGHKSDSSFPSSSSVSRNPSSSDQVDASSPIAAVLRRLTEAASSSEATSKCSSSQRAISATAVQGAVHREVFNELILFFGAQLREITILLL